MTEERSENAVFAVDIGLRFDRTLGSREEIKAAPGHPTASE